MYVFCMHLQAILDVLQFLMTLKYYSIEMETKVYKKTIYSYIAIIIFIKTAW